MVLGYWKTSLRTVPKKEEEIRFWSLRQGDEETISEYHERLSVAGELWYGTLHFVFTSDEISGRNIHADAFKLLQVECHCGR